MFSKYTLQQQQRRAAEAERLARRRGDHSTPARKDRRVMRIYGKTSDDLARAYQERVDAFVSNLDQQQVGSLLMGQRATEQAPSQHRFRDRHKSRERGRSYISTLRRAPRVALRGGGELNRDATNNLSEAPETLDGVPRIRQPPYSNPRYPWRERHVGAEIGPPMAYAAKTENERIQQAIAARGVVAGADTRWDATAVHASWRQEDKRQWKGQLFRSMSTPTDLRLQSVSGARVARPNSCLETFTPPIAALLRERIPDREVGPLFYATVRRGDRVPPAAGSTEDKWRTRRARSAQASVSRRARTRPKSRDQGTPGGIGGVSGASGVRARTPSTRQRVLTQGGADRPRTADSGASPTSAGVRRVSRGGLEFSLRRHRSLRGGSGNAPTPKAASGARRLGLAEQAAPLNDGAAPNRATGLATSASAPVVGSGRHADDASARRRQRGAAAAPVSQEPTTGAAQGEGRETGEALSLNGKLRLNIGSVGAGLGQPGTPGRDSMREGNHPRMAATFAMDMDDADGV